MRNHSEKHRDMARSILPSRHRRSIRQELALPKRANRHAVRQALNDLANHSLDRHGDFEDWDDRRDLRVYPHREIAYAVSWRRGGDKLNHFYRWALATTADLPIEDRLTNLRGVLPDGLIGDHAMGHLRTIPGLAVPHEGSWIARRRAWLLRYRVNMDAEQQARADVRRFVHDVLEEPTGHADLNRAMKDCPVHATRRGCAVAGCFVRTLSGRHDVEAFVGDVLRPPVHRPASEPPISVPFSPFRKFVEDLRSLANG